jgi:hypothetical protein
VPMRHDGQAHSGHGDSDSVARAQLSKLYVARLDGVDGARAIAAGGVLLLQDGVGDRRRRFCLRRLAPRLSGEYSRDRLHAVP